MPKAAKPSSPLKQATLSFGASKRSANNKKPAGRRYVTPDNIESDSASDSERDAIESVHSERNPIDGIDSDDGAAAERNSTAFVTPKKKTAAARYFTQTIPKGKAKAVEAEPEVIDVDAPLELNHKDARWKKYAKDVKAKRGGTKLIHAEEQDMFHDILRVFDMSYEYGPCVGVSRLERWERAQAMGLAPPKEVHDILLSNQGQGYAQNVLEGLV
ncbi:hypothetical protein MKEN_00124200 [Mycena kentingensis (nom. inval.)]|nr:hypothetical protein MKEN_00124200 [Mycena kentingensis (nom. inval.)]